MTDDDKDINDCFAYFGRTIYMAQTVEKGILNTLISSYENLTKTRFDELLAEKSQLTFGQLKREITEKKIFSDEVAEKIEMFHATRDWLAHNYWWDRTVEFSRDDLRYKILDELDTLTTEFETLNEIIEEENNQFLIKKGVNVDQIMDDLSKLDKTPNNPSLRKLTKDETLVGMYAYDVYPGFQIPIFQLEDSSYWTLCESGLTLFNLEVDSIKFELLDKTVGIFPVKQFNPKPKKIRDWEYELDLKKKGLFVKVEPSEINGKFEFKWTIKKHGSEHIKTKP